MAGIREAAAKGAKENFRYWNGNTIWAWSYLSLQ